MKKIFVLASLFISLFTTAQEKITEQRTVKESFTAISASDGIEMELTQANDISVNVTTKSQKDMDKLKTEVENGTLKVYYENKKWSNNWRREKIKVKISLPALTKVSINDGSSLKNTNGFTVTDLEIKVNDGSSIDLDNFTINKLSLNINDGSSAVIEGNAKQLYIDVKDGSSFNGFDLVVEDVDAKAYDGSSVKVNVTKEFTALANDGSSIVYEGNPTVKQTKARDGSNIKHSK